MRDRPIGRTMVAIGAVLGVALGSLVGASAAPSNDDFENAKQILALPYVDVVDTTGGSTQPGEPDAYTACAAAGASAWYAFTPSNAEKLTATTIDSEIGALVGVYTGTSLSDLSLVGCDTEVAFTPTPGTTYYFQAGDTIVAGDGSFVTREGIIRFELNLYRPTPGPCEGCPKYTNYVAPNFLPGSRNAGETSIGVNRKTNAAMFLLTTNTVRVTWDDTVHPPVATWKTAEAASTNKITFDPILWTDPDTGRTFVAQLVVATPLLVGGPGVGAGGSLFAFTDDDGASWITPQPPQANPGWDHQTVGGGPYPADHPLHDNPVYPNAVYYCAQFGSSWCARSDDGGLTWGPATPMGGIGNGCSSLHGHVAVAPNGWVYVPFAYCSSQGKATQGMLYSKDAGLTWTMIRIPGALPGGADPKISFDSSGRGYFIATGAGKALVSTSADGVNWTPVKDVGRPYGVRNSTFGMTVAGDPGRAAVAFYGSPDEGDTNSSEYTGIWHVYVATTYDGGQNWVTVDATPDDPVQRGCIWAGGGSNPCRNLLDFQGMTMDAFGRVLVGYADGCTSSKCRGPNGTPNDSRDERGVIARQEGGKGLIAKYDGLL